MLSPRSRIISHILLRWSCAAWLSTANCALNLSGVELICLENLFAGNCCCNYCPGLEQERKCIEFVSFGSGQVAKAADLYRQVGWQQAGSVLWILALNWKISFLSASPAATVFDQLIELVLPFLRIKLSSCAQAKPCISVDAYTETALMQHYSADMR